MKEFFSLPHILYMLITLAGLVGLYFIFRKRSMRTKKIVVFSITVINLLQHLLKIYIYPQYRGHEWNALSTAYNMCALLIIISPFVFLFGSELWKNFLTYVGTFAGVLSVSVTYWLAEAPEEQIRFVVCHALLLYSSLLPALFGIYKINYRKCLLLPLAFYTSLFVLLANDVMTHALGIIGPYRSLPLGEFLYQQNPCWIMHPPAEYPGVVNVISALTPAAFENIPFLWYAIPMYILISVGSFALGAIFDKERMRADFATIKAKLTKKPNQ